MWKCTFSSWTLHPLLIRRTRSAQCLEGGLEQSLKQTRRHSRRHALSSALQPLHWRCGWQIRWDRVPILRPRLEKVRNFEVEKPTVYSLMALSNANSSSAGINLEHDPNSGAKIRHHPGRRTNLSWERGLPVNFFQFR